MRREEIVTYLEMTAPTDLIPAKDPPVVVELRRAEIPCPELNRYFYTAVGGQWFWIDRLPWTYERWMKYLTWAGHETWVATIAGIPAGYFELDGELGGVIELTSFGLLPQFVGRGIGGYLLTMAVRRAWEKEPTRIWLHTSSLDHPHAMRNYLARGFQMVRRESCLRDLPEASPGPWPDAK